MTPVDFEKLAGLGYHQMYVRLCMQVNLQLCGLQFENVPAEVSGGVDKMQMITGNAHCR